MKITSGFVFMIVALFATIATLSTTTLARPRLEESGSESIFKTELTKSPSSSSKVNKGSNKKDSGSSGGTSGGIPGAGGGMPGGMPGAGGMPGGYGIPGGYGVPGFGGNNGWSGGYGGGVGGPSGGYSKGGVIRPTVVCKEKGPCYKKKLRCPAKCFTSYSRSGKGYGGGGGGGGCTMDCKKKCIAYC